MIETVGVVGLGNMGGAIAANLVKSGFTVVGYDVDQAMTDDAEENGVDVKGNITEIAQAAQVIILSLASSTALRDVTNELSESGNPEHIVIESGTFSLDDKVAAQTRLADVGMVTLDCPVSGTGQQARAGDIMVFASGDEESVKQCLPIIAGFSRSQKYCGEFGNGSRMKYVANHLIAIHNIATAEAMALGLKSGLDPNLVYEVISDSAATNRMFEVRGKLMADSNWDDVGATNRLFQKDLDVISDHIKKIDCPLPLFTEALGPHREAMRRGLAERDTATIGLLLEEAVGIDRNNWPPGASKKTDG